MPRLSNTAPNRILAADVTILQRDPLLALLNLETDDGAIELAMSQGVVDMLFEVLAGLDESGRQI